MLSAMKAPALLACLLLLSGCLTTPVDRSGGPGAVTITNTNPAAIVTAAQAVFPNYGYSLGPTNFPDSVSFDKPGGAFSNLLWGSYMRSVTIRAKLTMTSIPGSNDYRVGVRVSRVTSAGEAGFEDSTRMMSLWSSEFGPILRQIQSQAAGAGAN